MLDPKIMRRFNKILKSVDKLSEEKQVRLCHFLEGYIIGQMTKQHRYERKRGGGVARTTIHGERGF